MDCSCNFLVIRLSSIGDIVHALPAVAALGEMFPDPDIHWAVEAHLACLLAGNPFVRRVIKFDTLGWRKSPACASTLEGVARSVVELREVRYEAVIDFQGLFKSALIAWLSRSRERWGFAENWLREPAAGVFYTQRVAPRGRRHVIEMNLALAERLGARRVESRSWQFPLPQSDADDRYVTQQLQSLGCKDFIVISPGGGWPSKRWAPENYAELIRTLGAVLPGKILLTGSPEEESLNREILRRAETSRASYFPSTLLQLIALLRRAQLFLGGDTGPMHLAAAVRVPIVALMGTEDRLNTPERNGPFSLEDVIVTNRDGVADLQARGGRGFLPGISVESVVAATRERLARAHG